MTVGRGVEIALDRPEFPSPTAPPPMGATLPSRSLPSKRGCCFILRHTRNAARLGTCGKAAEFDHR